MILENHAWLCSCGESFAEPEQLTGHIGRNRYRTKNLGLPPGDHKPQGYCNLDTQEQVLTWNFRMWKGKWKGMLDAKYAAGELPNVTIAADGLGAGTGDEDGGASEEPQEELGIDETADEPLTPSKRGQRSPIGGMAKVVFRPKVFDVPEDLIHLYNLFLASMRTAHINYQPSIGDWLRDVIFQHYIEHPEVLDLSSLLMPAEKAALILKNEEQYAHA